MYMKIYKRKRENINLDQDINHISYNPNDNLLSSSPFLLFSLSLSLSLSLCDSKKKDRGNPRCSRSFFLEEEGSPQGGRVSRFISR